MKDSYSDDTKSSGEKSCETAGALEYTKFSLSGIAAKLLIRI